MDRELEIESIEHREVDRSMAREEEDTTLRGD
jgi:hypothetical protein